jgi:hypothetical protein
MRLSLKWDLIFYLLIQLNFFYFKINCSYFEQNLIESLMRSYDKKIRPPGTIQVKFALNLNQIITLIEKDQIIVINAFIDHEWLFILF